MHSTASDGTNPPEELAAIAHRAGLTAIALTDHDTTAGLAACGIACTDAGIDFVPGIELSADITKLRRPVADGQRLGTLHILGLFVRHDDAELDKIHHRILKARLERNPEIVANLNALGVNITYDEVLELTRASGTEVVGRPHIAQVMVKKGYVKSVQDAFAKYIGEGKPAYARKDTLDPAHAIEAIHHAGGLAILAHPIQLRAVDHDELVHIITRLKDAGLDGVEVTHTDHSPAEVDQYTKLARKLELLTSGGSDYHGTRKTIAMGSQNVSRAVYEGLKRSWEERSASAWDHKIENDAKVGRLNKLADKARQDLRDGRTTDR